VTYDNDSGAAAGFVVPSLLGTLSFLAKKQRSELRCRTTAKACRAGSGLQVMNVGRHTTRQSSGASSALQKKQNAAQGAAF
jgi:hypothetical protein